MKKFENGSINYKKFNFWDQKIMFYTKKDESCNIFIRKIDLLYNMTEVLWKCYRCDLTFKDETHAEMHKEISAHSVSKIKAITA